MNDDLLDRLEYRTWLRLKECTYLAMTALKQITAEGADDRRHPLVAREALEKIEHVLSAQWEGPGARRD